MKVGVVSQYGLSNFGNRLQSYAVKKVLEDLGFESEAIYLETRKTTFERLLRTAVYGTPLHALFPGQQGQYMEYLRRNNFCRFNDEFVHTRRFRTVSDIKGYDYYVIGSDQVWKPKLLDPVSIELLFLTFAQPQQKVCFSPSFGVDSLPEPWKPVIRERLLTFPNISVRETAGAEIVRELTGKEAEVLIDPTLMLDREDWLKVAKKPRKADIGCSFILSSFLGDMPADAAADNEYLRKELSAVNYHLQDWRNTGLYPCGPSEFIYLFDKAKFIQTDSFHTCIFAFLFRKPFLLYEREGKDSNMFSRIETLFRILDLERKYVGSGLENDLFECDYRTGFERLGGERRKVYRFLKRSFGIPE